MATVKQNDAVRIHYAGKLKDGTVFDFSEGRLPLKFIVGNREVIEGLEQ